VHGWSRTSVAVGVTAQISGQAAQLTIDATDLRFADLVSMRTLVMVAMKIRTRGGSVTLLKPRLPVVRMLDLLHVDELFSIRQGDSHPVRSAN
jgi:anti-anti-sigma regulatory factor